MHSSRSNFVAIDMAHLSNLFAIKCTQKNVRIMHWNGNRKRFNRFSRFQRNLNRANFPNSNLSKLSQSDDGEWPKLIIENYIECKILFTICCHCCCCFSVAAALHPFCHSIRSCECMPRCRSCLSIERVSGAGILECSNEHMAFMNVFLLSPNSWDVLRGDRVCLRCTNFDLIGAFPSSSSMDAKPINYLYACLVVHIAYFGRVKGGLFLP